MARHLYGAGTADFAAAVGTGSPPPLLLGVGATLWLYTAVNGTPISDALGVQDFTYTPAASPLPTASGANAGAATITTSAIGGYPFWAPDGMFDTLAVKSTIAGVDYWWLVNPSDMGDVVKSVFDSMGTLTTALGEQGDALAGFDTRLDDLEAAGGTLAAKVTSMSGPRRMWFRLFAEGDPTGEGEIDGDVSVRAVS